MGLTVEEALKMPDMKKAKLVAGGKGIRREIRWVTILEIIEDITRIHEGEFLITTGYGLNSTPDRVKEIMESLVKRNLSGVAVHTGYYLDTIPEPMMQVANEHELPLIEIPRNLTFSDITKGILEKVVNSQMELITYAERIQEEFTSLVLQNHGMSAITRKLSKIVNADIKILDTVQEIDRYPKSDPVQKNEETYLFHYPILVNEQLYGFLHAEKNLPFSPFEQQVIRQALTIYAIEFLKLKIIEDTKRHLRGDFLEDLLQKGYVNEQAAIERGRQLGYELTGQNLVMIVQSNDLDQTMNLSMQVLNENRSQYMVRQKSDHILILYLDNEDKAAQFSQQLVDRQKHLTQGKNTIVIGMGSSFTGVTAIPESAKQARYALLFSQYMKKEIIAFSELGAYQLFIQMKDNGTDLTPYYMSLLKPLLDYDESHHSELIKTFETYIKNNLKLQSTADHLFIHRHTLTYRLDQIKKKTGIDVHLANERIQLHLAVMAYRIDQMLSIDSPL